MPRDVDESPQDTDLERFGEEFVLCKVCKFAYYDELDACPKCDGGRGIDAEGFPWWVVVAAALALAGILAFLVL